MKTESRNMHIKPEQADTQLLPASMRKVADQRQAITANDMQHILQGQISFD
jgi:hypothetical protein